MTKNNTNTKQRFAFYGSLRLGEYNYNRLLKNAKGVSYIRTITLPRGFVMYSLGAYPMVVESESSNLPLTVDLFEIENDEVASWINLMEIGAGYTESSITDDNLEWRLYVGDLPENSSYLKSSSIVTSGDWTAELIKRRNQELEYTQ